MYDSMRHSYDYVKKYFSDHNCHHLDSTYKNARTKMKYVCACGNESTICFYSFQNGNRCRKCGMEKLKKISKSLRLSQNYVEKFFSDNGCSLLSEYKNNYSHLDYVCSCGNQSVISWSNFRKGKRCKICSTKKRSGPNHYEWIHDRQAKKDFDLFKQRCYKLLRMTMIATGCKKKSKTFDMLGYDHRQLMDHIQNHPDFARVKDQRWHIDHIFPIKAFVRYGIDDVRLINCLENLQPLTYKENISKSDNFDIVMFESWLVKKGVKFRRPL